MADPSPVSEFRKIGNYAIPAFAAVVTATLAAAEEHVAVIFGVYTIAATIVAYGHRLAWLRRGTRNEEPRDLPFWQVFGIFTIHVLLIAAVAARLWTKGLI